MSRILIKFPTRGRHNKFHEVLEKYISMANSIDNIKIIVSVDNDDQPELYNKIHDCVEIVVGESSGKIGAINRDIPDPSTFDILLLASDDMIPIVKGYDDIIRSKMSQYFPDGDGVLFFNDGYTYYKLNTLVICGSKYYQRFGYIYCPEYKSLWCDNEFMDQANLLGRQIYFHETIIKHEHPANNKQTISDSLYNTNESYFAQDKLVYHSRKIRNYDVSVLICTVPQRQPMFVELLNRITLLKQSTKLSIEVIFDDRLNISVGVKRNSLLSRSNGTYSCFVDDDDKITDDYFKIIEESQLKYDCIRLNGILYQYDIKIKPFYHSLKYDKWSQDDNAFYRYPNHLNPMKTSIAKQISFTDKNHLEDRDFALKLFESKLIKTEYDHEKIQYLYMFTKPFNSPKKLFGFASKNR